VDATRFDLTEAREQARQELVRATDEPSRGGEQLRIRELVRWRCQSARLDWVGNSRSGGSGGRFQRTTLHPRSASSVLELSRAITGPDEVEVTRTRESSANTRKNERPRRKSGRSALIHDSVHGELSRPKWRIDARATTLAITDGASGTPRISAGAPTISRDRDSRLPPWESRLRPNRTLRAKPGRRAITRVRMRNCTLRSAHGEHGDRRKAHQLLGDAAE
jgi:hypothetical protein